MAFAGRSRCVEHLLGLVEQERNALTNGDINSLAKFQNLKERAIERLIRRGEKIAKPELIQLANSCDDVQRLYSSAQLGLQSAFRRLQSLKQPASELKTYDATGQGRSFEAISREKFF
jgi:HEAT repeat protein